MNPTPNMLDQLLIAGPLIIMYQVGIVIIALTNRRRTKQLQELSTDSAAQDPDLVQQAVEVPLKSVRQVAGASATVAPVTIQKADMKVSGPKSFDMLTSAQQAANRLNKAGAERRTIKANVRKRRSIDGFIVNRQRPLGVSPESQFS
jgi:hypothetical protein